MKQASNSDVLHFMRAASAALVLVFVSCDVPWEPEPEPGRLQLTIEPVGELKVGQYTELKALITNRGGRTVDAVLCIDHSDTDWRFPRMRAEWTGPDGKKIMTGVGGGCGNSDAILDKHIVRLPPGSSFDPFGPGSYGNCTRMAFLRSEGRHSVTLTIDYSAVDPLEWNGDIERRHIDPEIVRKRLANVPRVKLATTAEFIVVK